MRARGWAAAAVLTGAVWAAGCGGAGDRVSGPEPSARGKTAHDHADEGPHHGPLVEWGDEEYHVEFTADREKGEVTVYVLGKDAKSPSPIPADKVVMTNADPAFTVELKPARDAGDPAGRSSRFVGPLPDAAKGRRLAGTLSGVVDGKPYAGDYREGAPHAH